MQTATWTKLKQGDWGIRVQGDKPARGDVVTVTKKSGDTSAAVVDAVLWTGEDRETGEPIALCAVVTVRRPRQGQPTASTAVKPLVQPTPAPTGPGYAPTFVATPAATPTGRRGGWSGARTPQPPKPVNPNDFIDTDGETIADAPTFTF